MYISKHVHFLVILLAETRVFSGCIGSNVVLPLPHILLHINDQVSEKGLLYFTIVVIETKKNTDIYGVQIRGIIAVDKLQAAYVFSS